VAFSCDGEYLATVGHRGTAKVWDANGDVVSSFEGHQTSVFCVAFDPKGKYLASGDSDRQVKLWDRATGRKIRTLTGHTDYVFGVAFSPDGRYLATASWREVIVWDVSSLQKVKQPWQTHLIAQVVAAQGLAPLSFGAPGFPQVVVASMVASLDAAALVKQLRTFDRLAGKILWVAFSPDGKRLAAAGGYKGKGEIKIWDAALWQNKP
jgi:WD40 repeat protein